METDEENDDDDGADDSHGMLELDLSLSGEKEFYFFGEGSTEKSVWNWDKHSNKEIKKQEDLTIGTFKVMSLRWIIPIWQEKHTTIMADF